MGQYICVDLKSFYASVECIDRGLDPLTTNLVVADESRTDGTICLAVSPSLKAYGISGRARLFEVKQRVQAIKESTGKEIKFIIATPRMQRYLDVSANIYGVYLKYVAPESCHVYSIDEIFIDVTEYLSLYGMTAHELAMTMIRDILATTGITATAGIGTNLYLAKIAMDIVAKHVPADKDGVRIAELDEISFREKLWDHQPLTDFWMIADGTYSGPTKINYFGKKVPVSAHGTAKLGGPTACPSCIIKAAMELFERIIDPKLYTRKLNVSAIRLSNKEDVPSQLGFFVDVPAEDKEIALVKATLAVQERFGKSAVFKCYDLLEGATTLERNGQIGGASCVNRYDNMIHMQRPVSKHPKMDLGNRAKIFSPFSALSAKKVIMKFLKSRRKPVIFN